VELGDAAQQLQIATAAYLMDNAGFHSMDERFNEEDGDVMPEDAVIVTHISNVLQRAEWPEALQEQVDELVVVLGDYAAVLEAGDAAAAAPLAAEAHTQQHDLSHAIEAAMEDASMEEMDMDHDMDHDMGHDMAMLLDPEGDMFPVAVTQMAMDAAGFHGMDERFNEDGGDVMPHDARLIQRVADLVTATAWPEDLQAQADEFAMILTDFTAALANGDTATVAPLAAEAHTQQHDLSAAITAWLGFDSDH
ncbi:MAG: hypothetical protein KDE51_15395, partial [Anaerolineales bacterium]|nr:hypothetical protein [Anaerolineales bacterium]